MPTKAQFRLVLMVYIGASLAMTLPRLWAAKHSVNDGVEGVAANAINGMV